MNTYKTNGTCASEIQFEIDNNIIKSVNFTNGCPGNLLGISQLVKGLSVEEVIKKFEGITCGSKTTSCPDQLAKALSSWKSANKKAIL